MLPIFIVCITEALALTTSGISSGGFFAVQFHVAFSQNVTGAGIIAGGPYMCSQGSATTATTACMSAPSLINMQLIYSKTEQAATTGLIDPLSSLQASKVWLFSGSLDSVVRQGVVEDTLSFYEHYITSGKIVTNFNTPAEHAWVTNGFGGVCVYLGSPYINNCNADGAGLMLNVFYDNLKPRVSSLSENLHYFQQSSYGNVVLAGMLNIGYIYVPQYCVNTQCEVHISFHGCLQSAQLIGDIFARNNGLNDWAESNNIVVIYPQVVSSLVNPQGCWDFWGYTGSEFAYKTGRQMSIVYGMVKNVPFVNWG